MGKEKFEAITEFIRNRRSVYPHQYIQKEIEKELLLEIIENANHAPTHRLTQPWRFKVVSGDKKTELGHFLAEHYEATTQAPKYSAEKKAKKLLKCEQADKILLICFQRDPKERVPEWEELAATVAAVQNIYLSCSAAGIGCYWSTPKAIEEINQFTHLNDGERCIGIFYMGYFEEGKTFPKTQRNPVENVVEWVV